jgi:hypothetical protein
MNTKYFLPVFVLACLFGSVTAASAQIKKATVPNVHLTPSLKTVMDKKDSIVRKSDSQAAQIETNGYILDGGNIIVDNLEEPKCVFYGNYNSGSGDAFQYFNIDTLIFECE